MRSLKKNDLSNGIKLNEIGASDNCGLQCNNISERGVIVNGNAELLNFVYQNSEMGVNTIEQLLEIVKDENFRTQLDSQLNEYKEINRAAREKLNENGYDEKGIGTLDKIKTYLMINMQTMSDKSTSHIAEMLIIGSNMGVINAIKNIRKYHAAEPSILELMERLLKFEERNIQKLKEYL